MVPSNIIRTLFVIMLTGNYWLVLSGEEFDKLFCKK